MNNWIEYAALLNITYLVLFLVSYYGFKKDFRVEILLVLATIFAIFITKMETTLALYIPVLVVFFKTITQKEAYKINKKIIFTELIMLNCLFVFLFFLMPFHIDKSYYGRVSSFMLNNEQETNILSITNTKFLSFKMLYHYGDVWINALLLWTSKLNPYFLYELVYTPLIACLAISKFSNMLNILTNKPQEKSTQEKNIYILLLVFVATLIVGIVSMPYFSAGDYGNLAIINSKTWIVFLLMLRVYEGFSAKKISISLITLGFLEIIIFYSTLAVPILSISFFTAIYFFIFHRKEIPLKTIITNFLAVFVITIAALLTQTINKNNSTTSVMFANLLNYQMLIKIIKDAIYTIWYTSKTLLLSYSVLLFAYFFLRKKHKEIIPDLYFFFLTSFGSFCTYVLLSFVSVDALQLFWIIFNISHIIIICRIFCILCFNEQTTLIIKADKIVPLSFLVIMFIYHIYPYNNFKGTFQGLEKYFYTNKHQKLLPYIKENSKIAFWGNPDKKSNRAFANSFIIFHNFYDLAPEFSNYSYSCINAEEYLDVNYTTIPDQITMKSIISLSDYLLFHKKGNYTNYTDSKLAYLKYFKIDVLMWAENRTLDPKIMALVTSKILFEGNFVASIDFNKIP